MILVSLDQDQFSILPVIMRKDVNWTVIYEFIFDRLRAVRQDMVIQRLDVVTCIRILNPIVKFHIYAAERMRDKSLKEYVPKFNDQHLVECIKQLLVMYDNRDFELTEEYSTDSDKLVEVPVDKNRIEIEALYILLYLGNFTSITRGLSLPSKYRESSDIKKALNISRAWYLKNYVRVCREISQLSGLFLMAALNNLQVIRRDTWAIMSAGYKSKNLTFPGEKLQSILLYKNMSKVAEDCNTFGIKLNGGNIHFDKIICNHGKVANPEKLINDIELSDLLPDIII
ncbi:SAC3 family protein C isoform X2 [Chelonus insularis]|uniref:SAC3 family protein C isoform X2 n=1 Tax=Chelonus insularis TaxID=460826 RepID=UPI00158882DD|nr:SAC3 family protein C isoform X2 [Chelonus insularis]